MPIIGRDLASMNEKMLYCIWAALNNQLKVDGVSDTEIQNLIAEFKEIISQRVSLLGESNYIEKVQKLLDKIKVENKEESTNGE